MRMPLLLCLILVLLSRPAFCDEPTFDGKGVSEWAAALEVHDDAARSVASAALTGGEAEAVPVLAALLSVEKDRPREEAARILLRFARDEELAAVVLDHLLPVLEGGGNWARAKATLILLPMGAAAKPAAPLLVELLGEDDRGVRGGASSALLTIGPDVIPALLEGMKMQSADALFGIQPLLEQLEVESAAVVPILLRRYEAATDLSERGKLRVLLVHWRQDPPRDGIEILGMPVKGDDRRLAVVKSLWKDRPKGEEAPALLTGILAEEDIGEELRYQVVRALVLFGDRSRPAIGRLTELLANDSVRLRAEAAETLGVIGGLPDETVAALRRGVGDPNERVVRACVLALGKAGEGGIRELSLLLAQDDFAFRELAAQGLGGGGEHEAAATKSLLVHLGDEKPEVRVAVATSLGKLGKPAEAAVPALIERLRDDPVMRVRIAAASALGGYGAAAKSAVRALRAASESKDFRLAASALRSLERITGE